MATRSALAVAVLLLVAACGQSTSVSLRTSPTAGSPASPTAGTPTATPTASGGTSPSPSTAPTSNPLIRLVIADYSKNQVRLARFDAVDVATVAGAFDVVVGGYAIIVNGRTLLAVSATGAVRTLGHLAADPSWSGPSSVAVEPGLGRWFYSEIDTTLTTKVHLASASSDRVIATIPSPDGGTEYQPFAWNPSGTYMVKAAVGLGGVGPFLEYRFPVVRLDLATGAISEVSPACVGDGVLDDGTLLCRTSGGGLEVRAPNGASHVIQVATASSGTNGVFTRLAVSTDHQRFIAARNGNPNPDLINYQMAVGSLSGSSAATFGPPDFFPDVWLSDGRVVADHLCFGFQGNGGPCNAALDGTYFISADGKTQTLFFKLAGGVAVVAAV